MLTAWLLLLPLLQICLAITGSIEILPQARKVLDPSRASILLLDDNGQRTYHFNGDGSFDLPIVSKGTYQVLIQSLDFKLSKGNKYTIVAENSTNYEVFEGYTGERRDGELDFTGDEVQFKSFADMDPSNNFLNSLPLVPMIRRYPIIGVLIVGGILIVVSPTVISMFDPDFNEKFIEATADTR